MKEAKFYILPYNTIKTLKKITFETIAQMKLDHFISSVKKYTFCNPMFKLMV